MEPNFLGSNTQWEVDQQLLILRDADLVDVVQPHQLRELNVGLSLLRTKSYNLMTVAYKNLPIPGPP